MITMTSVDRDDRAYNYTSNGLLV